MAEQIFLILGYALCLIVIAFIIVQVKKAIIKIGKKYMASVLDKTLIEMLRQEISEDKYTYYFFATDEFFSDLSLIAKRVFHDQLPLTKIMSLYMIGCTPEHAYIIIRVETNDRTKVSMSSYSDIRDVYDNTPFKNNIIDWHEWYKATYNKETEQ